MNRILFYCLFFLFILLKNGISQTTSSPYSFFAEGQIETIGTGTNHAMGGCGIALKSNIFLNSINPASYSGIDSLSFLFEAGLFGKITHYKTSSETQKRHDANLRYLAMGCRITPWWSTSFGFMPFSSVGYKINSIDYVEGELSVYKKIYEGSGGINRFYWGHSLKLFKNLSLGMNISYYLGSIQHTETGTTANESITYAITNSCQVHTAQLDYGAQYTFRRKDMRLTLGAIYGNLKELSSNKDAKIVYAGDTINLENSKEDYSIPRRYGFGIAYEKGYNFRAGFDYEKKAWRNDNTYSNTSLNIRNGERFAFGLEYTPYKGYHDLGWKRIYYRVGVNYNKTYLIIDKVPLNSYALVVGVGVPLRRELTMVNVSIEAGKTGTTRHGLIEENYLLMHLNFTLHDKWFIKHSIE